LQLSRRQTASGEQQTRIAMLLTLPPEGCFPPAMNEDITEIQIISNSLHVGQPACVLCEKWLAHKKTLPGAFATGQSFNLSDKRSCELS
jgi:hypothetical protein